MNDIERPPRPRRIISVPDFTVPRSGDPLLEPEPWYEIAADLMSAARTLFAKARPGFAHDGEPLIPAAYGESLGHSRAFLLLAAFALENTLKGTKVKQIRAVGGTPVVAPGKHSPERVWGHDLTQLASDVGLVVNHREEEMLHVLKRNIEWAGRYPAPSKEDQSWFLPRFGTDDLEVVTELFERIKAL